MMANELAYLSTVKNPLYQASLLGVGHLRAVIKYVSQCAFCRAWLSKIANSKLNCTLTGEYDFSKKRHFICELDVQSYK